MARKKKDESIQQFQNIERLEMMEEKFGVCLVGMNATVAPPDDDNDRKAKVYGEVQAIHGTEISDNLNINAVVYGNDGVVLGTSYQTIYASSFFALCPLSMSFYLKSNQEPARLRVYPTKG